MRQGKKNFIVLNIDLSVDQLPPLLQDFRFIDMGLPNAMGEVVEHVKKQAGR
jgi:hypothetical protein